MEEENFKRKSWSCFSEDSLSKKTHSTKIRQFSLISTILLTLMNECYAVRRLIVPLASNLLSSPDYIMTEQIGSEFRNRTLKSGIRLFAGMIENPLHTNNAIKVFQQDGRIVGSLSPPSKNRYTLQLREPGVLLYSTEDGIFSSFTVQISDSSFSLLQKDIWTTFLGSRSSFGEETSSFVFIISVPSRVILWKLDDSCLSCSKQTKEFQPIVNSFSVAHSEIGSSRERGLAGFRDAAFHILYTKIDLSEITRITTPPILVSFGISDNLNPFIYYMIDYQTKGNLKVSNLQTASSKWAFEFPDLFISSEAQGGLCNLGATGFLAWTDGLSPSIFLVKKQTFTLETEIAKFPDSTIPSSFGLVGAECSGLRCYFSAFEKLSLRFKFFYLLSDACQLRDPSSRICPLCHPGYFRTNLSAENECIPKELMTPGTGADSLRNLVVPCTEQSCIDCFEDFSSCNTCNPLSNKYLNESDKKCLLPSEMRPGFGADLLTGLVATCADQTCICFTDSKLCQGCRYDLGLYSTEKGECRSLDGIPMSQGVNTSDSRLVACQDKNCADCKMNFSSCTRCSDPNNYLLVDSGQCSYSPNYFGIEGVKYERHEQILTVRFKEQIEVQDFGLLQVEIKDLTSLVVYPCDIGKECMPSVEGNKLQVLVALDRTIVNAIVSIVNSTNSDENRIIGDVKNQRKAFREFPIRSGSVSIIANSKDAQKAAEVVSQFINSIKTVSNIISMTASPATAIALDKAISEFNYLQLIGGPILTYPDLILYSVTQLNLLPFSIGNPFESWVEIDSCDPHEVFQRNGIECNFLYNYGEDTLVIYGTLLVTILITACMGIIIKLIIRKNRPKSDVHPEKNLTTKKVPLKFSSFKPLPAPVEPNNLEESSKLTSRKLKYVKAIEWISSTYGFKFFLIKMDGIQLEVICFIAIQMGYSRNTLQSNFALSQCILILAYYSTISALLFSLARRVTSSLFYKYRDHRINKPVLLEDAVDFKRIRMGILDFYFEGYRCPDNTFHLYLPIFNYMRTIVLSILIFFFKEVPVLQLSLILIVEFTYLFQLVRYSVKASKHERWIDISIKILTASYVGLKLVSNGVGNEGWRQHVIGGIMCVCLISLILISFIQVIVSISIILWTLLKKGCSKLKKDGNVKKESIKKEIEIISNQKEGDKQEGIMNERKESGNDKNKFGINDSRMNLNEE